MRHLDHCSFCGSEFKDGVCTDKECQRLENELPAFPWSICFCGERMFRVLSFFQLFQISWLAIFGIVVFFLSVILNSAYFSLFGISIVLAWFLQRFLVSIEIATEDKQAIQEMVRKEKQFSFNEVTASAHEKKEMKDEDDKIKAYEARLWGIRLSRHIVVMSVVFIMLATYSFNVFQMPTMFDYERVEVGSLFTGTVSKLKESSNSFLSFVKKEANWSEMDRLRLKSLLINKRGFSYEQFKEVEEIVQKYPIKGGDIIEMVINTNKYNADLYNHLTVEIPKFIKDSKARASKPKKVNTPSLQSQKPTSYFQKLNKTTGIITTVVSICLLLVIVTCVITGILSFILAHLYFVADEAMDVVRADLSDFLKGVRERKRTAAAKPGSNKKDKSDNTDHGIMNSFIGSTISAAPQFMVEYFGKRRK